MGQQVTRLNVTASNFPFLSEFSGRGIIVKQTDQNYIPSATTGADSEKDLGIPEVYYCHNTIGTLQGFQSVGYSTGVPPAPAGVSFDEVIFIQFNITVRFFVGITAQGILYRTSVGAVGWEAINSGAVSGYISGTTKVTTAHINGITYLYFSNLGCYQLVYTGVFNLAAVTLTGLNAVDILGITAAQNYLIAWAADAIYWSSLIDPTDFVPSLATGAGGGNVQSIKGSIVACVPHTVGFVIYTESNIVVCTASGNTRYPFNFREIVDSSGISSADLVTWDANTGNHYAYTASGLQMVTLQQTQTVFPELTDFLAGAVFEDFEEITNELVVTKLTSTMIKRLALVSDRYLIISYGISYFTHALVFDLILKRWGKLKHPHISVMEFRILDPEFTETPRHSIAFVQSNGKIDIANLNTRDTNTHGILLLGKIQYVRQRTITLHTVDFENSPDGALCECFDKYSYDGKNTSTAEGKLARSTGLFREFIFRVTALNHSLLFKGAFHMLSVVIHYSVAGRR